MSEESNVSEEFTNRFIKAVDEIINRLKEINPKKAKPEEIRGLLYSFYRHIVSNADRGNKPQMLEKALEAIREFNRFIDVDEGVKRQLEAVNNFIKSKEQQKNALEGEEK